MSYQSRKGCVAIREIKKSGNLKAGLKQHHQGSLAPSTPSFPPHPTLWKTTPLTKPRLHHISTNATSAKQHPKPSIPSTGGESVPESKGKKTFTCQGSACCPSAYLHRTKVAFPASHTPMEKFSELIDPLTVRRFCGGLWPLLPFTGKRILCRIINCTTIR